MIKKRFPENDEFNKDRQKILSPHSSPSTSNPFLPIFLFSIHSKSFFLHLPLLLSFSQEHYYKNWELEQRMNNTRDFCFVEAILHYEFKYIKIAAQKMNTTDRSIAILIWMDTQTWIGDECCSCKTRSEWCFNEE